MNRNQAAGSGLSLFRAHGDMPANKVHIGPDQPFNLRAPQPGKRADGKGREKIGGGQADRFCDFRRLENRHIAPGLDLLDTGNRVVNRVAAGHGESEQQVRVRLR